MVFRPRPIEKARSAFGHCKGRTGHASQDVWGWDRICLGGWVYFVKRGDGVRILVRYLDRERTEQIEPYSKSHNHSDESDAQFGRYQSNKRKNGERDNDHN